jgi:hypothetical protein
MSIAVCALLHRNFLEPFLCIVQLLDEGPVGGGHRVTFKHTMIASDGSSFMM